MSDDVLFTIQADASTYQVWAPSFDAALTYFVRTHRSYWRDGEMHEVVASVGADSRTFALTTQTFVNARVIHPKEE